MIAAALMLLAAAFVRPCERVATMDPAFAQSVCDAAAVQLVYETPLTVDYAARPYRLAPGACELPEVSEDGLRYRFRVRSAGLSAADVVRSLERLRDDNLVTPNRWLLKDVATVTAADPRTVEVKMSRRSHVFPWLMALAAAGVAKADGSGTGPYELAEWRKNHSMTFRRRPGLPRPANGFDEVKYLVVDDASTRWLMFLRGELDYLDEISQDNWDAVSDGRLLKSIGAELHVFPTLEVAYLGINMSDPRLGGNAALRRALNAAFDYPAWEKYHHGRTAAADGPVPPGVSGRLETPFEYAFDLEKAKRLMVEAGYPGGVDPATGRRLELSLAFGRANQEGRERGELLAAFYQRLGIRLTLKFYTWDAFLKATGEGRVQLFCMAWLGDYPDAENFLQLFHSKNARPGPNRANYANPEFDREYEAAMAAATETERNAHWARCQELVRADCPWVFLSFGKQSTLTGPRVGGYIPGDFPYGQEQRLYLRSEAKR